jgi:magnesium transporter
VTALKAADGGRGAWPGNTVDGSRVVAIRAQSHLEGRNVGATRCTGAGRRDQSRGAHESWANQETHTVWVGSSLLIAKRSVPACKIPPATTTTLASMQVLTRIDEARVRELLAADEFFWLDLEAHSEDDIQTVARLFELEPLAVDDLHDISHSRARLHTYDGYMLLVYFAARPHTGIAETPEGLLLGVKLLVSGSYVVTIHMDPCDQLKELQARYERGASGSEEFVVFTILDSLTDSFFPVMSQIGDEIDDLEEEVIKVAKEEELETSRHIKRELIFLRTAINSQRDLFGRITDEIDSLPGLEQDARGHFRNTYDHLIRLSELNDNYRELLASVRDIYVSTVSNRLNEIMKRLTIVATLFLPLTFVTGFFGQNFRWMVDHVDSFASFAIFGIGSLLVAVVLFLVLVRRSESIG